MTDYLPEIKTVEMEVDVNKKFHFPAELVAKKYKNNNLIIYTEGVLWLVLSDNEKAIFDFLAKGKSIAEAIDNFEEQDVIRVISQIEAKQFEHPIIKEHKELNIYIYLTNNCNEHCEHCYMYSGDIKIQELSPDIWIKILANYKKCGGHGVTFTGGEVTVYHGFKQILHKAHELGLQVTVLTNGIQWSTDEILECSKYIDEVQVSIDGYDSNSYYAVRRFNGFDRAIATLIKFSEYGVRTSMAVTPLYNNLQSFVKNFEPFAKNIIRKYPQIYIRFNLELLTGRNIQKDLIDNIEYQQTILALIERLYPNYHIENFAINYQDHIIRKNCGFGEITIAPNGDVYWCNRIHELSSKWNVLNIEFQELIKYSYAIKNSTDVNHSETCKNCEIKYICGGDCRMNYPGIKNVDEHCGTWNNICPKGQKENIYKKMILCNEYFYTTPIKE